MCRNTSNCTLPPVYCENDDKSVHWDCSWGPKGGSTSAFTVGWWINCLVGAWTWCTVLELPNLGRYFRVICYYGSIRAYETGFNYYYGQALHVESRVRGERQGGEGERSHWSSVTKCSRQLSRGICISFDTPYRITDWVWYKHLTQESTQDGEGGNIRAGKSFDWLTDVGYAPHHPQHKWGNSNKSIPFCDPINSPTINIINPPPVTGCWYSSERAYQPARHSTRTCLKCPESLSRGIPIQCGNPWK